MSVYDSLSAWINNVLSWMGSCLGGDFMDDPQKRSLSQGQLLTSFSEDFWGTSTGEIEIPIGLFQRSFTSLSTSNLNSHSDLPSMGVISRNEFVNNGLLVWTKIRLQWIGVIKYSDQSPQAPGSSISLNATYDSVRSTKGLFRRSIPLGEMVDLLNDAWEEEGLYD